MKDDERKRFEESLERLGVRWVESTPGEFSRRVEDVVEPPAVGAPLPWKPLKVPDPPVQQRPTMAQIERARTGVSAASIGIANYGSIVVSATPGGEEPVSLFPEHHVAVLDENTIQPDMSSAVEWLGGRFREGHNNAVIATGPSATADMGELVYGAHGPRKVTVILVSGL